MFVVELLVSEHKCPEVVEAKKRENLQDYETFEEAGEEGQEMIGSSWVITRKEKHDGQKTAFKARLVAKGFQERLKPQSDSPRALKENFKLLMAVATNEGFKLASVDIRAAFLQAKILDRDIFLEPL